MPSVEMVARKSFQFGADFEGISIVKRRTGAPLSVVRPNAPASDTANATARAATTIHGAASHHTDRCGCLTAAMAVVSSSSSLRVADVAQPPFRILVETTLQQPPDRRPASLPAARPVRIAVDHRAPGCR